MFENVPERLATYVRDYMLHADKSDRSLLYLAAAGGVIAEYLEKNFFGPNPDEFLEHKIIKETGDIGYMFPLRILLIGETLFSLRNCPGFLEFCGRLKNQANRNLRSTFFEMWVAKYLFRSGFEIYARRETQVKGEDFDFEAVRDGEHVNVEVTALADQVISKNTIINALRNKRKQLPDTAPAIIFVIFPRSFTDLKKEWDLFLFVTANEFFVESKRINAIVFLAEKLFDSTKSGVGGFAFIPKPYPNMNARIPLKDTKFLFEAQFDSPLIKQALKDQFPIESDKLDLETKRTRTSEFYQWVDHLVPIKNGAS